MKLHTAIITHLRADFDAVASLCACELLYPGCTLIRPNGMDDNVRRFLSLYLPHLNFETTGSMNNSNYDRIVVVDTNRWDRTGIPGGIEYARKHNSELIVIDHHPGEGDISGNIRHVMPAGACSTIITGLLRKDNIELPPLMSTLLLLGIHEDTGSFTYPTTTVEDLNQAGFLMNCGASMRVLRSFLQHRLTEAQIELFKKADQETERVEIAGMHIILAIQKSEEFINGLDVVAQKLRDANPADAMFLIVAMSDSIFIVARSRERGPDVGKILSSFGGGGHKSTASACLKNHSPSELSRIKQDLLNAVGNGIKTRTTAASIMTSPVKTMDISASCETTLKYINRHGFSGIPVVYKSELVGILSRGDAEKAVRHKLGHAPAKAFMSRNLVTVVPESGLEEMRSLLVENNISRLPVLKGDELIGIVSRRDLLRALHEDLDPGIAFQQLYKPPEEEIRADMTSRLKASLPERLIDELADAGRHSAEMGFKAFLVGGCVRDIWLKKPVQDLDISVEGNAIELAAKISDLKGGKLSVYQRYGTATLMFNDGQSLDFATCRKEYYEFPASSPTVSRSSLREDLYRRDFTINAMAIPLSPDNFGFLIDPHGGSRDLQRGLLRVLHSMSFIEDPARLFRAARFMARFGFRLEKATLNLARDACTHRVVDTLAPHRLRDELLMIMKLDDPEAALEELNSWGVLKALYTPVEWNDHTRRAFSRFRFFKGKQISSDLNTQLIRLYIMLLIQPPRRSSELLKKNEFPNYIKDPFVCYISNRSKINHTLLSSSAVKPSTVYNRLSSMSPELISALLCIQDTSSGRSRLENFLNRYRDINIAVTGNDLRDLGLMPGPDTGKILRKIKLETLDRGLSSKQQMNLACKMISNIKSDNRKK